MLDAVAADVHPCVRRSDITTTPYKLAAASVLVWACAGAGVKPAPAPTTQSATATDEAAPESVGPDVPLDISKFKHPRDDDESSEGRHEGYWRQFAIQLSEHWIPPAGTTTQTAAGCFQILPEGRIATTRLMSASGDNATDEAIQRAMTSMQRARNEHPIPVPTDQLPLIKNWVCFKFSS